MVRNIAEKAGEEVMTQFDQRGQKVNTQYNAGRDIHFRAVQTSVDLIAQLEKLNGQIVQAQQAELLRDETATDDQYKVTKANQQAKKPIRDIKTLVDQLSAAQAFHEN